MKINHSSTLSLLASGIISVFVFFLFLIIALFNNELLRIRFLVFIPFFTFIFSFIIIKYFAEQYLYNKLKVIYKIINKQLKDIDLLQAEQDIAEWMQDRNIQLAEYQKQMKFRKEFLGNVSHELKTPLTSIQAYIETLQHSNLNEEKRLEYLQKAMKNTLRLNEIVSDLQQIHDLETNEIGLKYQKFQILELIQESIERTEILRKERNIKINIKNDAIKDAIVFADEERIKQVLDNLITNAVKYNIDEGKVEIGIYDFNKKYIIEISDNGIGINEKEQQRIFERFYRAEKSRNRMNGGSGLGLSIVKHIIEAHNEKIFLQSTPNKGSTFSFTLKKAK